MSRAIVSAVAALFILLAFSGCDYGQPQKESKSLQAETTVVHDENISSGQSAGKNRIMYDNPQSAGYIPSAVIYTEGKCITASGASASGEYGIANLFLSRMPENVDTYKGLAEEKDILKIKQEETVVELRFHYPAKLLLDYRDGKSAAIECRRLMMPLTGDYKDMLFIGNEKSYFNSVGPLASGENLYRTVVDVFSREVYPPNFPKLEITCEEKKLPWLRGDANFTGKPGGAIGNTYFGASFDLAEEMKPTLANPGAAIIFAADEVDGLNKPVYKVFLIENGNPVPYTCIQDRITAPGKEGEYVFNLLVDWGNGDNSIAYWFKIKVENHSGAK